MPLAPNQPPAPGLSVTPPKTQPGPKGVVREPVPLSYNTGPWRRGMWGGAAAANALSAVGAYAWQASLPALLAQPSTFCLIERTDLSLETALKFYGIGASTKTATARIWGLKELKSNYIEYIGDPLIDLTLTIGTGTIVNSRVLEDWNTTYGLVGSISITADYTITPGGLLVGYDRVGAAFPAGCMATIVFDKTPGYFGYIVEILPGANVTSMGLLVNG